jgi:hypothetical protein
VTIKIERTGNIYSFASTEYRVTYPDGHVGTIWSPPWHEEDDKEEDRLALVYATKLWESRKHKEDK